MTWTSDYVAQRACLKEDCKGSNTITTPFFSSLLQSLASQWGRHRFQASLCGTHGGRCGKAQTICQSFGFFCQRHSTNAPHSNWRPYHQCYLILATDKIIIWNVTLTLPPPTLILIPNFKKQYWIFQFSSFFPIQKQILTCTNTPYSFKNYTCTQFWRSTIKKINTVDSNLPLPTHLHFESNGK